MNRIFLGNGRWFDADKATLHEEGRRFDGSNFISVATGTQWEHEEIYLTQRGRWVKHTWSQWQGSRDHWEIIDEGEAHAWLIDQGHGDQVPGHLLEGHEV